MSNLKQISGALTLEIGRNVQNQKGGILSQAIAAAAVLSTGLTQKTGLLAVRIATKTAIFALYDDAGTPTTSKLAGNAIFNASKDNASTINVYWDTDQVKIQNKTTGSITILQLAGTVFD